MRSIRCLKALLSITVLSWTPSLWAQEHRTILLEQVTWSDLPTRLATAVVEGDPETAGARYGLLVRIPDGKWIPPHWHPKDKQIVVLRGTLLMGHGDVIDAAHTVESPQGSITSVRAEEHHFEGAKGETILLLYGEGPLVTNYLKRRDLE